MSNEWFDNNLENRFNEMPADLNLDAAWNRLEKSRKKKNRKGLIFFFTGLGSTTLIGLALVFWTMTDRLPLNQEAINLTETTKEELQAVTQNSTTPIKEEITPKSLTPATTKIKETNQVKISSVPVTPILATVSNDPESITKTIEELNPNSPSKPAVGEQSLPAGTASTPPNEPAAGETSLPAREARPSRQARPEGKSNHVPKGLSSTSQRDTPKVHKHIPQGLAAGEQTLPEGTASTPPNELAAGEQTLPEGIRHRRTNPNSNPNSLTLSSLYGPSKFIDKQESLESVDRIGAGLYFQRNIKEAFFWRTGLEYNRIANQSSSYTETITMEEQDQVLLEIRLLQDGTAEEVYGPGQVMILETTSAKLWSFDESISVPIQFGWHFINQEKIQFDVYIGTALGYSLDSNNLRWDGHAGLDFNYRIGNRYSLMLGLTAGNDLQKALSYRWIQGRLGMKMNLFR